MPPRKTAEDDQLGVVTEPPGATTSRATPPPPGPHQLEIRYNGKIVCLQRVHSYTIDQQDDKLTVTGVLKLAPTEN